MKLAYYQENDGSAVRCNICPNNCLISENQYGLCHGRKNLSGKLYALNYGQIASMSLDPIEKKPLRNFYPGSSILSVGTFGCNFRCDFCQNWSISQASADHIRTMELSPEALVQKAIERIPEGNIGIAFTYNEPTVWFEYVLDTAIKAKAAGLKVVLVTNGFINRAPLQDLLPFVDAMNIDLKAYNESFYSDICGGTLDCIKETIKTAIPSAHIEITTLLIPGLNDNPDEIEKMAKWLSTVNPNITLHLSRYFPQYKRESPLQTPLETLTHCQLVAQNYLSNVYIGNVHF